MKFSEIIKANNNFKSNMDLDYEIAILSNVTIAQIQPIFEYNLRKAEIGAVCLLGDYDNIIQDSERFYNKDAVVVFWEACNIIDGFHYKVNLLSDKDFAELLEKTKNEIRYLFNKLKTTSVVIFNKFSSSSFNSYLLKENRFDEFCNKLNDFLCEHVPENFFLISIDKIFNQLSVSSSVDSRNFYTSKSLYTVDFLKSYVVHTSEILKSIKGKTKKALILDCDNTLWDGIIGEDGIYGLKLDSSTPKGAVFQEVQSIIKSLAQQGVVVGLCSKNNYDDVQEVFNKPGFTVLSDEDIVIKRINWSDKASNLQDIANELNIGTDSLVFVDDSDFEINLVRDRIPNLLVSQVPSSVFDYPTMMMELSNHFYKRNITREDTLRVRMYKEEAERKISQLDFTDIDSYISSLGLEITVFENDISLIQRISQLTNKTNQFNLTTKRYTESDIEKKMKSGTCKVIALSVKDKFGDFGITGVAILETYKNTITIDTFLLSCRVLGRQIEKCVLNECLNMMIEMPSFGVVGIYIPTPKNSQVKDFYLNEGFELLEENNQFVRYFLSKEKFVYKPSKIIKVNYGK